MDTHTFNGKPYFILEQENGIFCVLGGLKSKESGEYLSIEENVGIGKLTCGLDIKEIPDRRLSILVEVPAYLNNSWTVYIIEECRKLASIAGCDYVSVEKFGNCLGSSIHENEHMHFYKVAPRLFRKIVND